MGATAKRAMKKILKKNSAHRRKTEPSDFLPLDGGPGRKIPERGEEAAEENTATVLYIGHIPHGFYEEQMEGFFKQFGKIKRLRMARSRKTGRSKHYAFVEFENPEVARVVADEIHGYLLFEHNLQIQLIPPERVHPKLWRGVSRRYGPLNWTEIEQKRHNKERTTEEHQKMVQGIVKRDEKRRKRIKAAGIDYECPELLSTTSPVSFFSSSDNNNVYSGSYSTMAANSITSLPTARWAAYGGEISYLQEGTAQERKKVLCLPWM